MTQAVAGGKLKNLEVTLSNYKGDKSVSIRGLISDITIYENMFKPTIWGAATIIDTIGLISGYGPFQMLGEEKLTISYSTIDSNSKTVTLNFIVYKIAPIFHGENYKQKRYVISFCSEEHLKDAVINISKAYNQPNSEIVKNILTEFTNTKKTITVQPTKGNQQIIIPNLNPFGAIEMLRGRSIAEKKYTSASYVFFENFKGFQFTDIENLIDLGKQQISANKQIYTYYIYEPILENRTPNSVNDDGDPRSYNTLLQKRLIGFSQSHKSDTIEKLKMGLFRSKVWTFDPINVTIDSKDFAYDFSKITGLGKNPSNSADFIKEYSQNQDNTARIFSIFKDSKIQDTYLDDVMTNSTSYMTELSQNLFTATTIGDTNVVAGDLITIPEIPAFRQIDKNGTDDKLLNGEFLITSITHKIGLESYVTDIELYKNGYSTSVDNSVQLS